MSKYYIKITNDETEPRYVERGLGFGGVKITDSLKAARRYDTEAEAEKVAAIARSQKNKEPGGEMTTVEIVAEADPDDAEGWEVRARFELPATGAESRFEMKKTDAGIVSRYVGMDGTTSRVYDKNEMIKAVSDWINASGAWFAARLGGKKAKK